MHNIIQINNEDNVIDINTNDDYVINYTNVTNCNITVNVTSNVNASLYLFSNNDEFTHKITYNIEENSSLEVSKFYLNNNTNDKTIINLNGSNSKIDYFFSAITIGKDIYHIEINHKASNTKSNVINRDITINESQVLFDINSYVPAHIEGCVINQESRVITTNNNEAIIKPNMFIDDFNAEARHSSVVGKFDSEELFYLMSRGIDYDTSIKLLVKGFLLSKLHIDLSKREQILNIINNYWR